MGSLTIFARDALLNHTFNADTYTPPEVLYLAFSLAFSVRSGDYQWTASGSGTDEYYLEADGGGDPGLGGDPQVIIAGNVVLVPGSAGSLAAGEWAFDDNDSLGYDTIYIRLSDGADPDSKDVGFVLAGGNPFVDTSGLNEPVGNGYARTAIVFDAAGNRIIVQGGLTQFDQLSGDLGWATHWCIMDAATMGNALAFGVFDEPKQLVNKNRPYVKSGEVTVTANAGELSDYLAEAWLNFMFNNVPFSSPNTYVGWATNPIVDADTGSTVSEPGAGDYARVQVNPAGGASPAWNVASGGALDNADLISHEPATAPQGTFTAAFVADAATGGNLLMYDNAVADQEVGTDDTVEWPAGDLNLEIL